MSHELGGRSNFDIVIVGGGSGGGVVASRLSEDLSREVALVEAGPDYTSIDSLPEDIRDGSDVMKASRLGDHFWTYTARVNHHISKNLYVMGGKVIGGGSSVNATYFIRGIPEDFDSWSHLGNDKWTYQQVLPYFRKSETDLDFKESPYHGNAGPIPVWRTPESDWSPFQQAFYSAALSLGFPTDPDINHPDTTGIGPRPLNSLNGIRMSTARTYLETARSRDNLTILSNRTVTRVLFKNNNAVGIELLHRGELTELYADIVVLCAGAVETPAVLCRSGVGSADTIKRLGIEHIADLPGVGLNLQNHPAVPVHVPVLIETNERLRSAHLYLRYSSQANGERNDLSISPLVEEFSNGVPTVPFYSVLRKVVSTGSLRVISNNPDDQPVLNYNYLMESKDIQAMRESVRTTLDICNDRTFSGILGNPISLDKVTASSDDDLDPWIWKNIQTTYHTSGTCRMGLSSDSLAVTDQFGHVHHLENLWIGDSSLMPDIIRGDTTATVIMIAERVAEWISESTV